MRETFVQSSKQFKNLPYNWAVLPFNKVFIDITGGNVKVKKTEALEVGLYPVVDQGQKEISGYLNDRDKLCKQMPPVIIFGDHTRSLKYIDYNFVLGADGAKVLVAKIPADLKYLYYFLKQINIPNTGYNRHFKYLKETNIIFPPLEIQKQIAEVLNKADELIKKKEQANEKLDEFLQSTFLDMFGDPVTNSRGWEVKKLKGLSKRIMSGNTPKGGSQVYVSCGIEFYRSQNVWNNRIEKGDIAYIDEETHKKMKRSSLKHKDILITKTGRINTENSSLGRSALYEGEDDKANVNGHVYFVRLKEGINHKFVLTILTSKEYREYIRRVCVGGIDKRQLNKEHIEDFPIICPPIELQNKFTQMVEKVEEQKAKNEIAIQKLDDLFNSLLQRAFKGEL